MSAFATFLQTALSTTLSASVQRSILFQNPPVASCPPGWSQLWTKCFYLSPNTNTWQGAQDVCQGLGGDSSLARIESKFEQLWAYDETAFANIYIGAKGGDLISGDSWQPPWSEDEPSSATSGEDCVSIDGANKGMWSTGSCSASRLFLCARSARVGSSREAATLPTLLPSSGCSANCGAGWVEDTPNCACYRVEATREKWEDARASCQALGGDLASVPDSAVMELLVSLAQGQQFWLGGNDVDTEGTFVWSDGEDFTYTNWVQERMKCNGDTVDARPNAVKAGHDYVTAGRTGFWDDTGMNGQKAYACRKNVA